MNSWQTILWSAPLVILAAVVVGWAAETAQLYMSQGLALAILAWLQTSPEFAVEAVIAWHKEQNLMIANLTGSLRLLTGFGWPLIYFTHAFFARKKGQKWPVIKLDWFNGLEVFALIFATEYFAIIWLKESLTVIDSIFLILIYLIYLVELARTPKGMKESEEDLPWLGKKISQIKSRWFRVAALVGLFGVGGLLLKLSTEPFLRGLEALAVLAGLSTFYFVQWCAPFVSEFPEKVTAFQWAKTVKKAPMAVINMVSSNIVQWTLMAAAIPIIYSLSSHRVTPIIFNSVQLHEIAITIMQSILAILFLMDLEIDVWNATGLLVLWAIQFFWPSLRTPVMYLYALWSVFEFARLLRKKKLFYALVHYWRNQERATH